MSLWGRLGALLGIGASRVELTVSAAQVYRESEITGQLILHGGRVPQKVRSLTVDLYEFWFTGHGRNRQYHQRRHQREVLAEFIPVDPGTERAYPFQLRIPMDARCTRRREGWEIRAEAHIPWSVDPRASAPLQVLPHPEVLAVQRCARDYLRLIPVDWDGRSARVMYNFRAPQWLQHLLDGLRLILWVDDEMLEGKLDLNKQERDVSDVLKSLIGADHEEVHIRIPRHELITKRGTPNPAGAYEHLKVLFERLGAVVPTGPPKHA